MLGVLAAVEMLSGSPSGRSAVLGYCAAHRDDVLPAYLASLALEGNAELISEPPAELRPADADAFLAWADLSLSEAITEHVGIEGLVEVTKDTPAPEACPHCGGTLSWGTGPHVHDAEQRPNAVAWECLSCGAAGMLTPLPAKP